jgi:hypothetical protein
LAGTELTSFWGKHSETLQLCDDNLRRQRSIKTLIIGLDEIVQYCLNAVVRRQKMRLAVRHPDPRKQNRARWETRSKIARATGDPERV